MSERRFVRGPFGAEVWVDIDRDMDQATFDRQVAAGELTPLEPPTEPVTEPEPAPSRTHTTRK